MDTSGNDSNGPTLRAIRCAGYSEFVALAATSRFVASPNVEVESDFVVMTDLSAVAISALDLSILALSVSPPGRALSPLAPIRI
jgi:hypothetical protein